MNLGPSPLLNCKETQVQMPRSKPTAVLSSGLNPSQEELTRLQLSYDGKCSNRSHGISAIFQLSSQETVSTWTLIPSSDLAWTQPHPDTKIWLDMPWEGCPCLACLLTEAFNPTFSWAQRSSTSNVVMKKHMELSSPESRWGIKHISVTYRNTWPWIDVEILLPLRTITHCNKTTQTIIWLPNPYPA